jgi:hypothetical protein
MSGPEVNRISKKTKGTFMLEYILLGALALSMLADLKSAAPGFPEGSLEDRVASSIRVAKDLQQSGDPVGGCVHATLAFHPELVKQRVINAYHPPADVKSAAPGFAAGSVEDQVATCASRRRCR